jgi:hypothetical protein
MRSCCTMLVLVIRYDGDTRGTMLVRVLRYDGGMRGTNLDCVIGTMVALNEY